MGQKSWAWGCALVATIGSAGWLFADEKAEEDLFSNAAGTVAVASTESAGASKEETASASEKYSPTDAARRIERTLDQPLRAPLEFVQTPLNQIMNVLQEEYEIPIQFDTTALDAVASSPDVEVTITIANVTLRSALALMLRSAGGEELTYGIDHEVLLITTQEEAQKRNEVRVYRVDDLIPPQRDKPSEESSPTCFDGLVDVVTRCVANDSWEKNGTGEGQIALLEPGILVVTQTRANHEKVEAVLDAMRAVREAIQSRGGF